MNNRQYKTKQEFVDDFSLKYEEMGYARIYGQIIGWLLVCEPEHQSFSDLIENLDISKASVSIVTRTLLDRGIIEKVRIKGDRQIHFKLKDASVTSILESHLRLNQDLQCITSAGLSLLSEENSGRLSKTNSLLSFITKEIDTTIQKYKAEFLD
ncbi:hypothetical protein EP331_12195 [bacterium]|nr:MAG: hypothetical protein EP331_12195 [bacterium]